MMRPILAIAKNTFREAIRDRVLYLLVFFAVAFILGSEMLAVLAVGAAERVVVDLGLAAINFFGAAIAVFLGIGQLAKEVARRTIYTVISKPIPRAAFVAGKVFGAYAVVVVLTMAMTLVFAAFAQLRYGTFDARLLAVILLMVVEDLVLIVFAVLFSSFTSPILASLMTVTVYVIGHLSSGLKMLAGFPGLAETVWGKALLVAYYLLPNLERLNLKNEAMLGEPFPHGILEPAVYGTLYAAAVFLLAVEVFRRRDFT